MEQKPVHIVGAGLAGSEAAWQLVCRGVPVVVHEMKPGRFSPAHRLPGFAELVCSNSLRSDDSEYNAVGLLHQEMRLAGSLVMAAADACRVPAGGALAVDREAFSAFITSRLRGHPLVQTTEEEVSALPPADAGQVIIATGPLTADALAEDIRRQTGEKSLSFYDAIAPVVYTESINMDVAWFQSRYDKGGSRDYINCPLNEEQYNRFVDALLAGEKTEFREFEKAAYFDGCLPAEVMAERGRDTLLFGPMKPVGLTDPKTGRRPYAVVQLRQDNFADSLRNIVGFQTKLKYGAQKEVFRLIPGLENAEFARFGGIHKNTFIRSPLLLDGELRLKTMPHIRFAGQITGCEGYVESAAVGLLAGCFASARALGEEPLPPPAETAFGAMLGHITSAVDAENFQPMNINFGLFPEIRGELTANGKFRKIKGTERKNAYCRRALAAAEKWAKAVGGKKNAVDFGTQIS